MIKRKMGDSISTRGTFTASELRTILEGKPDDAKVEIKVLRGDPRDPREAGYRETFVNIEWEVEL